MELLLNPQNWISLLTLTALEIVLGIDNIVFISIIANKLPENQRKRGRYIGLLLAMLTRILLLFLLSILIKLTNPIFTLLSQGISGRDIILIIGGLFLLVKSTIEIHGSLEGTSNDNKSIKVSGFFSVIIQIALVDIVFSLDSVITAIGIAEHLSIMVAAIIISIIVMIFAANLISDFIENHPTMKMLALSFLILIGFALIADGLELHIPKGYIYFAMAFSILVEMLNLKLRGRSKNVTRLQKTYRD
ncbi:MAG: TerC family protein [Thermodesulfobacteriota bacterium]